MASVTVEMKRGKETQKSWRYEAAEDDVSPDNVYLRKAALQDLGDPDVITVTITPSA